jgi:adenosylcobyric acid synthase
VARAGGREFVAGEVEFAAVRDAQLDRLGDLVGDHVNHGAIAALLERGAPARLPVIPPAPPAAAPRSATRVAGT